MSTNNCQEENFPSTIEEFEKLGEQLTYEKYFFDYLIILSDEIYKGNLKEYPKRKILFKHLNELVFKYEWDKMDRFSKYIIFKPDHILYMKYYNGKDLTTCVW